MGRLVVACHDPRHTGLWMVEPGVDGARLAVSLIPSLLQAPKLLCHLPFLFPWVRFILTFCELLNVAQPCTRPSQGINKTDIPFFVGWMIIATTHLTEKSNAELPSHRGRDTRSRTIFGEVYRILGSADFLPPWKVYHMSVLGSLKEAPNLWVTPAPTFNSLWELGQVSSYLHALESVSIKWG